MFCFGISDAWKRGEGGSWTGGRGAVLSSRIKCHSRQVDKWMTYTREIDRCAYRHGGSIGCSKGEREGWCSVRIDMGVGVVMTSRTQVCMHMDKTPLD